MKMRPSPFWIPVLLASAVTLPAQKSTSDLVPPPRRQSTVELAAWLTRDTAPAPVPDDLPHPFNPAGFDVPDGASPNAGGGVRPNTPGPAPGPAVPPAGPVGDREILEMLAAQINPTGTILLRGAPRLMIANKPFEIGTRFGVTYKNQDYELELVAIDRTTFTLRFRNEEIIRPIARTSR